MFNKCCPLMWDMQNAVPSVLQSAVWTMSSAGRECHFPVLTPFFTLWSRFHWAFWQWLTGTCTKIGCAEKPVKHLGPNGGSLDPFGPLVLESHLRRAILRAETSVTSGACLEDPLISLQPLFLFCQYQSSIKPVEQLFVL